MSAAIMVFGALISVCSAVLDAAEPAELIIVVEVGLKEGLEGLKPQSFSLLSKERVKIFCR